MSALVLYSGGMDSLICLKWALKYYKQVEALCIDYGQKNSNEIIHARRMCRQYGVKLHEMNLFSYGVALHNASKFALPLLNKGTGAGGKTACIPARNGLFLYAAASLAAVRKIDTVITGISYELLSFPDTSGEFINAIQRSLVIGLGKRGLKFCIKTPLLDLTRTQRFELAEELGCLEDVIENSFTCFNNSNIKNLWGWGCGTCGVCRNRRKAWNEFQKSKRSR